MSTSPYWLAALIPAGAIVGWASSQFTIGRNLGNKFEQFLQDWNGKPERRTNDGARILEEREPGVIETLQTHTDDIAAIKSQLNGGGLGSKMAELKGQTDELSTDIQAVKDQVAEVQRFSFRLARGQERLETKVDDTNRTLGDRMFDLEEVERAHRAMLHELGMPVTDNGGEDGDGG